MNHGHGHRPRRETQRHCQPQTEDHALRCLNPELGYVKGILDNAGASHLNEKQLGPIKDALRMGQPDRPVAQGLINQRPLERLELLQQA